MGWENSKLSGGNVSGHDAESRVSDQSSQVVFNVVEDLGGGLKAWGQIDNRINLDRAAGGGAWASGNSGVGFMHDKWGKFTLGSWDVHYQELAGIEATRAGSLQTLFGHGLMSQVASVSSTVGAAGIQGAFKATGRTEVQGMMGGRARNLMMWDSPNWNGFTARLAYSTNAAGNEGNDNRAAGNPGGGRAWTGALRYNNGPWTAGLSYWNENAESRVVGAGMRAADGRSTRGWVGYTFAMGLKVGLAFDRSSIDNHVLGTASTVGSGTARRTNWMLPVTYTFGPHAIYGKYGHMGSASGSAIASGTGGDYGGHAWMLGYDYAFSKRTSAGVFYTKVNNDCNAACTVGASYDMFAVAGTTGNQGSVTRRGEDARQWYIGMAHSF
jgi:predicted porin